MLSYLYVESSTNLHSEQLFDDWLTSLCMCTIIQFLFAGVDLKLSCVDGKALDDVYIGGQSPLTAIGIGLCTTYVDIIQYLIIYKNDREIYSSVDAI